jgi:hypothetical protein
MIVNNKQRFIGIGFLLVLLLAYLEISSALAAPWNWERLLSVDGLAAVTVYALLVLSGVYVVISNLRTPQAETNVSVKAGIFRWFIVAALILAATWVYLYSPWQKFLFRPWVQLLFAAGLVQVIRIIVQPNAGRDFSWSDLALAIAIFIFPRIVSDARAFPDLPILYRGMLAGGLMGTLVLAFALYHPFGVTLRRVMVAWREGLARARWAVIPVLWAAPILYHYAVGAENYILLPNLRFLVLLLSFWLAAYLACDERDRLVTPATLGVHLSVILFVFSVNARLLLVVDYPFSLSWSEGNRFYDYSLIFGQSLYNHDGVIVNPYSSPGRYGLWGILFLWEGLPIWAHRLWNVILHSLPPLLFAFFITRKLTPSSLRIMVMMWIAVFLVTLAPLHAPFVIASVILALFAFDESLVKRGISLVVSGLYVGISRWTWVFAPGALGALIDLLLFYPKREGSWLKRILPTIVLVLLGILPGLLPNLSAFHATASGESLTGQQPLLWYRLLPNDTLGPGVLFLALYYTAPLLILLAWWMISKRLQLDWLQMTAIWGALAGFFIVGLVISTKIGGGGDLHNLDMYLITLLTVMTLSLTILVREPPPMNWRPWAIGLVIFLGLLPLYGFTPFNPRADYHSRLDLADADDVEKSLLAIRAEVETAARQGEVLFMDQRQLVTFGYITGIPFISEYEKKYMMDQAMASNISYFEAYYRDLADRRFALIVTEPLRVVLKAEMGGMFSEENDAWVTWVSAPTLCYYEPLLTERSVGVQLLIPKSDPGDCALQLPQELLP